MAAGGWGMLSMAKWNIRHAARVMGRTPSRRYRLRAVLDTTDALEDDFPCFHLCFECGYLSERTGSCPSCGTEGLLDLGKTEVAHEVRSMEDVNRHAIPGGLRAIAVVLAVLVFVVIAGLGALLLPLLFGDCGGLAERVHMGKGCMSSYLEMLMVLVAVLGAFGFGVVLHMGPRWLTWMRYSWFPVRPWRWRQPLPMPPEKLEVVETAKGKPRQEGEGLEAPISKRRCVGYHVSIVFDQKGDARPPEYVLEETRMSDFSVGGVVVEGSRATLKGTFGIVPMTETSSNRHEVERFLHERGIFLWDGELLFYEVVLTQDDECTVHAPRDGQYGPIVEVG